MRSERSIKISSNYDYRAERSQLKCISALLSQEHKSIKDLWVCSEKREQTADKEKQYEGYAN